LEQRRKKVPHGRCRDHQHLCRITMEETSPSPPLRSDCPGLTTLITEKLLA
jgi:hypothetical protein